MSVSTEDQPVDEQELAMHLARAGELLRGDRLDEAAQEIELALALSPVDLRARNLLGLLHFRGGRFDEAQSVYQELLLEREDDTALRLNLGLVELRMGHHRAAVEQLALVAQSEPDNLRALGYYGLALMRAGDLALARQVLQRAGQDELVRQVDRMLAEAPAPAAAESDSGRTSRPPAPLPRDSAPPRAAAEHEAPKYKKEEDREQAPDPGRGTAKDGPARPEPLDGDAQQAPRSADRDARRSLDRDAPRSGEGRPPRISIGAIRTLPPRAPHEERHGSADADQPAAEGPESPAAERPADRERARTAEPERKEQPEDQLPAAETGGQSTWLSQAAQGPGGGHGGMPGPAPSPLIDAGRPPPARPRTTSGVLPITRGEAERRPSLPPLPPVEQRPTGQLQALMDFVQDRELTPATEAPFALTPDGMLLVRVSGQLPTRSIGVVVSVGELGFEPLQRRSRGRMLGEPFGDGPAGMFRATGSGMMVISQRGGQFAALALHDESLYVRESLAFAFAESLHWENGRLPGAGPTAEHAGLSDDLGRVVQFRGTGQVVLRTERPLFTVRIGVGQHSFIEVERLAGWVGRIIPSLLTGDGGEPMPYVEVTGEGFLLVEPPSATGVETAQPGLPAAP